MTLLGEAFDSPPSKEKIEIYWRALRDLSIGALERGCINVLNTKKFSTFPLVAEIRAAISGNDGLKAWILARKAVSKHGAYMSVIFPDPVIHSVVEAMGGWKAFCYCTDKERPFKQKEFERLYEVMKEGNRHPEKCIGIHEISNSASGYRDVDTTILIETEDKKQIEKSKTSESNKLESSHFSQIAKKASA